MPGDHFTLVMPPHVENLGTALQRNLAKPIHMDIGLDRMLPAGRRRSHGRALEISDSGISFDPRHPAFIENPYPFLKQLREQTPIYRDALSTWWVTRYADVSAGLRSKSFSVDSRLLGHGQRDIAEDGAKPSLLGEWFRHQESAPLARLYNNFMLFLDPPKHTLLRKVFAPLFSPESVQRMARSMDDRIQGFITDMRVRREPDLVRDLALPLPVGVISDMYGVPREDAPFVMQWARDLSLGFDVSVSNQAMKQANRSAENFANYLQEHIARLKKAHRGLLDIDAALQNGLSMDELVSQIAMSYFAGFETTTSMIGNGCFALLHHPDQLKMLRENPALTENAVEELLRYDCPVRYAIPRHALVDMSICGQRVQRGETVMFMLSSANRDPTVFSDPDRLDIGRDAKHHVAFSHGLHYCLGASLARLELQRVFIALAQQSFSLVPGGFVWRDSLNFRSLDKFRVTWSG